MEKPIYFDLELLDDNNGHVCYVKGRSYDLQENFESQDMEKAVNYYTFISRDSYVFRNGVDGQYIILNKEKDLPITIMLSEKVMSNVMEVFRNVI